MKLYPYQLEACNEIDWFDGRSLIALDPGLGKTGTSLHYIKQHPQCTPCLIICPASVKYHWKSEAKRWAGIDATVLEGLRPYQLSVKNKAVIINYTLVSGRKKIKENWVDYLRTLKFKTVIIDECQSIGGKSKQSENVKELCRGVPHILALSGTPAVNRPIELFNTLSILKPKEFRSRIRFASRYCNPQWTPWGWDYTGCSNSEELHEVLLDACMVRRRKCDVLKELPEKIREVIPISLSDELEYNRANTDFLEWLKNQSFELAEQAGKAEEITKVGYLLRLAAQLKVTSVVEWINNFLAETDEKLVVGAIHKGMIKALREKTKAKSVLIDGDVTGHKRKEQIDIFREDSKCRVCFGNIKAMGTGTDGLQIAHHIAIVELGWTPGGMIQLEDRCHRIGVKDTVFSYWLISSGTIEEKLAKILQQKQENLSNIFDGGKNEDDIVVYNQLLREMKRML